MQTGKLDLCLSGGSFKSSFRLRDNEAGGMSEAGLSSSKRSPPSIPSSKVTQPHAESPPLRQLRLATSSNQLSMNTYFSKSIYSVAADWALQSMQ
ncbi:hypothetical protein HF086_004266 [Spodoptera exigua]|uniref:Uncharacterized protein n=1 Tax=Spodoptera exigua TaxID=7107 RepID=A0A922MV19_SPOEX|nr:hypothetical protein HF086_004266 [Spodoptera exigua]